jgi:multidrug resistance efflux pump
MKEEITEEDHSRIKAFSTIVNQRSELAQEIISRRPDLIERSALYIFLGILLLILVASWFVKYPDIIEARATLTAENAPKEIVAKQTGRLMRLFVHNNQRINNGQIIGWLESTASHEEVLELSRQIDSSIVLLNLNRTDMLPAMISKNYNSLGELQQGYQQFISSWQLFNDYRINGFYTKKKNALENDISSLEKTKQTIQIQKDLAEQDIKLAKESFDMNKKLFDEKVLTKEEYRTQDSKYVNRQMAIPQLEGSILANETQTRDKFKEIDQLNHDFSQQTIIFRQSLQSLKSLIDDWIRRFVLQSPVNGTVSFIIPLQENQYLQAGKLLGYINPIDSHFYAETTLPQYNFGKIDTGLSVQLRFDAYPYQEMGFVEGRIDYISSIPSDSGFLATIKLRRGLVTNNDKSIPYKNGLKAQALIVTKNMRLADRLFYNIVKSTSIGSK